MAIQLINIGQIANDGTGDDLREAMIKINQNFEELDLRDDEQTTASNLGAVGEGLFFNRVNYDLQFKKIAAGDNITLSADNEKIVINASNVVTDITVDADSGSVVLDTSASLTIAGGDGISTSIVDGVLTITNQYVSEIVEDTTPQLGGDLDAQGFNILNLGTATGSFVGNLTGNVTGLVNGIDPAATAYYFNNIDLGNISLNITNIIELLAATVDIDLGTAGNPAPFNIDLGAF
jgi:hypothetical protein